MSLKPEVYSHQGITVQPAVGKPCFKRGRIGFGNRSCDEEVFVNAYEQRVRHTGGEYAPWLVVPADPKWMTPLTVAGAVIDVLEGMELAFPTFDAAQCKVLQSVREILEASSTPAKNSGLQPVQPPVDGADLRELSDAIPHVRAKPG